MTVFFFSAFSTLLALPFFIAFYEPMTPFQWASLLLAGVSATGGQFFITAAYRFAPAKEIAVFDYSQVLFAALLGFFFLQELPDAWSLAGYFIIIGAAAGKQLTAHHIAKRQASLSKNVPPPTSSVGMTDADRQPPDENAAPPKS